MNTCTARVVGRWLAVAAAPVKVGASQLAHRQAVNKPPLVCLKPAQVLSDHSPAMQTTPELPQSSASGVRCVA